ncbi:hypothetical protein L2E82_51260 [Cichorium intybus]|nr:hypothetical protein L2E82_51260 [Cichorium intybus]
METDYRSYSLGLSFIDRRLHCYCLREFDTPDSRLPTPDSRLPTPDSRLPTPDSRLPTPDSRLPTPDSRLPTPDSRLPTPDSRLTTPHHGNVFANDSGFMICFSCIAAIDFIKVMTPMLRLLRICDSDEKPAIGYVYEGILQIVFVRFIIYVFNASVPHAVTLLRPRIRAPPTKHPFPISLSSAGDWSLAFAPPAATGDCIAAVCVNSTLPTPDSRLPTPDSRLPTPDSRLPTPDSRLPTPDSRLPTPDSRLPTPDSRLPTPDSRLTTPHHGNVFANDSGFMICSSCIAAIDFIKVMTPMLRLLRICDSDEKPAIGYVLQIVFVRFIIYVFNASVPHAVTLLRPRIRAPPTKHPFPISLSSAGDWSLAFAPPAATGDCIAAVCVNSTLPTPDSRLPTPDSRLPTPDSRLPTPDSRLPTPDSRLPTPDSRLPTPDSRLPTPD